MRQLESKLQRRIRRALEQRWPKSVWTKIHGGQFQEPGIGDLLGCVNGYHIEVEVKRDNSRLRDTQELRLWRIQRAGGAYIVARSPEQAIKLVELWLRHHAPSKDNITTISSKSVVIRPQTKVRRIVHATAHGKDSYGLTRPRKVVVERINT